MAEPGDDLVWTIAYALWREQRRLPRPGRRASGWPPGLDEFRAIARAVAEHMALAGWETRQRPPKPDHKTPGP